MNRSFLPAMALAIAFSLVGIACNDNEPDTSGTGGDAGGTSLGGDGSGGSGPACGSSQVVCDGICTNLSSDPKHCGDCATLCGAGEGCSNGKCERFGCTTGQVLCDDECINTQTNPAHCGGCDKACGAGQLCSKGACVTSCPDGLIACEGTCVDPTTDRNFCGATSCSGADMGGGANSDLGQVCGADELCDEGECRVACSAGQLVCGGDCVDPKTNPRFCGATDCSVADGEGVSCGSGEACVDGACLTACPSGQIACDGACINPLTDREHCGATDCSGEGAELGEACESGQVCVMGACQTTCPSGQLVCNGKCIDPNVDPVYCGATDCNALPTSGVDCASGQVCVMGVCEASCPPGQLACGAAGSEQCVDPLRDREYCGATDCAGGETGEACEAGEVCSNGSCVTSCPTGELECGGKCVDPTTDLNYCGATDCSDPATEGVACPSGNVCSAGQCAVTCVSGQIVCGGKCIDPETDNAYCGASDDCSGANIGETCDPGSVCTNGACAPTCAAGQFECNGACVNPLTNAAYCGASDCDGTGGEACAVGQACVSGVCVAFVQWSAGERVDNPALDTVTTEQELATDSAGNAVLLFRQQINADGSSLRPFATYYSSLTKTWSAPVRLDGETGTGGYRVRSLRVSMNAAGVAVAVWLAETSGNTTALLASRFQGGSWSLPVEVASPAIEFPDVYVDNLGRGVIVYSRETNDDLLGDIYWNWQVFGAILNTNGTLGATVELSALEGDFFEATSPRIDGNAAGQAVVVFFNKTEGWDINEDVSAEKGAWAIRYDSSSGFQPAASKQRLNEDLQDDDRALYPDVAVDAAGNAHVVWALANGYYAPVGAFPEFPTSSNIIYNYFNGSTWGAPSPVTSFDVGESAVDPRISASLVHVAVAFQSYSVADSADVPTTYKVYGSRLSGGVWSEQVLDSDAMALPQPLPSVGVSGVGDAHFVWTNRNQALTARYVASSGTWSNAQNLAIGQGAAQWPVLATTAGVEVMAAWIQANNGPFGMFVGRYH